MTNKKTDPVEERNQHNTGQSTSQKVHQDLERGEADIMLDAGRELLKACRIDLSNPVPDIHGLISIDGKPIASPGNKVTIKAAAKSAKTKAVGALVASFLTPESEVLKFVGNPMEGQTKVVYIDTEQGLAHVHKLARNILFQAGLPFNENHHNLEVIAMKELSTKSRLLALQACASPSVGLIIIDGVVDIVYDFNDLHECTEITDILMELASTGNLAIVSVIHTNKKDRNSRGHLGAFIEQKSETTIEITREGSLFTCEGAYTRNAPFEPFTFFIDDQGIPLLVDPDDKKEAKKEAEEAAKKETLSFILRGGKKLKHSDLVTSYMQAKPCANRTAVRHISEAWKTKYIQKDDEDQYELSAEAEYREHKEAQACKADPQKQMFVK